MAGAARGPTLLSTRGPVVKDLVLVGCGHSHIAVLRRFGMAPVDGVRLTVVTREVHTPYSGMLPGFIAGHYGVDEVHIDTGPLARFAGARLYQDEVVGLDLAARLVFCRERPPIAFDLLSINVGSTPNTRLVPGALEAAIPVKPIDRFIERWDRLVERVLAQEGRLRIGIVGGGAGSVELALAARHRLTALLQEAGLAADGPRLTLLCRSDRILPSFPRGVGARFETILAARGVEVLTGHDVVGIDGHRLLVEGRPAVACDEILWVTQASSAGWLGGSGLAVDAGGFVRVSDRLQSLSHEHVFAAGDIAAMEGHPRPKSGVYAVRDGPALARNLRRALTGRPLRRHRPQKKVLALITTGDRRAVATRGTWSAAGRWAWRWKDWIDRRFMRKYNDLPVMRPIAPGPVARGVADGAALKELSAVAMRCGGCGAKVGSTVLERALGRLDPVQRADVLVGLDAPDDAAVVAVPPGKVIVHSVDYFRSFLDDPYLFGKIAANHSLSDLYAMGALPQTALAIATVPYGLEAKIENDLSMMMAGALEILREAGAALVGGHTSEGAELSLGFAVNGLIEPGRLARKGGMLPGDRLILTKPLGTGTLFAAEMRMKAKARWIQAAIAAMVQSNRMAASSLQRHGVAACTDVTGFGLLGHLVEMTRASEVDVALDLDAVPAMAGALKTLDLGIFSSLQPQNVRLRRALRQPERWSRHPSFPLIFDPQTSGGLLAAVPEAQAAACLADLHRLGYREAAVIGTVLPQDPEALEPIRLAEPAPARSGERRADALAAAPATAMSS